MRIFVKLFFGAASVSLVGVLTASCASTGCEGPGTCAPAGPVGDSSGGENEGGADVIAPPGCDLTKGPKDSPSCVVDAVGVFVSPTGDDGAAGTKGAPVKTIAKGVDVAATKGLPRVYVCEGTYDSNVEIKTPLSVYGGLTCAWEYTGAKPKLAPAKGIALRVTKVTGPVVIEDLDVVGSPDASKRGDTAIAVFVSESANVSFRSTSLKATAGVSGSDGDTRSNFTGAMATVGGNANGAIPGTGASCSCMDASSSKGGNGAAGNGADVSAGSSVPAIGGANSGSSNLTMCGDGTSGVGGDANAAGAPAASAGSLSATGWTPGASPASAPNGHPAQGGGGGGAKTQGGTNAGGGGGCGGCGGAGGTGAGAGGSSFSLLSFNSTVSVDGGVVAAGAGGAGGTGGSGQDGQSGGGVGTGACNGGPGGHGAGGSGGSGGAGGHSAPVGFVGPEPRISGATTLRGAKGEAGPGGQPGAGLGAPGAAGTPGPAGRSQDTLSL